MNHLFHVYEKIIIELTISIGRANAKIFIPIIVLCVLSNASAKSITKHCASEFFAHTPSIIWWIVRICVVEDQFLRKLFWFFLRTFSPSNQTWLRNNPLWTIEDIAIRFSTLRVYFLMIPRLTFFGKVTTKPFVYLYILFWFYVAFIIKEICYHISLSPILREIYRRI